MKRLFFFVVINLITSSLCAKDYCKIADRITNKYVKTFAKPNHLQLTGYGGAMMYDVKEINLFFTSYDSLNLEQARSIFVEGVQTYLSQINQNESVRPYLHNYPFTEKNLYFVISFEDPATHNFIEDNSVALVSTNKNGIVSYSTHDPETQKFQTIHKEPYEEALAIYQSQQPSCNE